MGTQETENAATSTNGTNGAVAPSAPAADPPQAGAVGGGKNIVMPSAALKALKAAERARGEKSARAELDALAKQSGFDSVQDMFASVAELRKKSAARPEPKAEPRPIDDDRAQRSQGGKAMSQKGNGNGNSNGHGNNGHSFKEQQRAQRQIEQERQRVEAERKARIRAERQRREADRARQDGEVRQSIREAVIKAGVSDVDYGAFLLEQHVMGKPPEEIEKFDEGKWFEDLRSQRPYLFGEVVKPATTGPGPGSPPAPQPRAAIGEGTANGQGADVRKMNSIQFREHLAKRGLSLDDTGQ
jgi:hypothetical protein